MRRALTILAMLVTIVVHSQEHPNLILTAKGVKYIQANLGKTPLFDKSVEIARAQVDAEIKAGIDVPIPKDLAGGYTHKRQEYFFKSREMRSTPLISKTCFWNTLKCTRFLASIRLKDLMREANYFGNVSTMQTGWFILVRPTIVSMIGLIKRYERN